MSQDRTSGTTSSDAKWAVAGRMDMTAPLTGYPVKSGTWPLAAGKPFQGLPGAALGGLGMAGAHPRRREVGSRLGEPLLQVVDFRLMPVLR